MQSRENYCHNFNVFCKERKKERKKGKLPQCVKSILCKPGEVMRRVQRLFGEQVHICEGTKNPFAASNTLNTLNTKKRRVCTGRYACKYLRACILIALIALHTHHCAYCAHRSRPQPPSAALHWLNSPHIHTSAVGSTVSL